MTTPVLRICTFNVHGWATANGRSNTQAVIELMQSLNCDLILLNEVPSRTGQLVRVAHELQMQSFFAPAGSFLGNAILTKPPIVDEEALALTGGSGEVRSAQIVTLNLYDKTICCVSTHLDHRYEDDRCKQLRKLLRPLAKNKADIRLIGGDFNALRLTDYPNVRLDQVSQLRKKNHWEEPIQDTVLMMDNQGWVDALRFAQAEHLDDYKEKLTAPLQDKDQSSCWAGTRIDYFWVHETSLSHCKVHSCGFIQSDASDHLPLLIELSLLHCRCLGSIASLVADNKGNPFNHNMPTNFSKRNRTFRTGVEMKKKSLPRALLSEVKQVSEKVQHD